ncbi:Lrp/AsnC family transcriptional regulator [Allorhizobium undicola]|uniref:Lrp/AsnC family transcriptional regulator n=1 Tax=Allorhizobium undicola TaxID=78527 RepID=UPI003D32F510
MDKTDVRILHALSKDSRASVEAVAETVNLSPTPVRRRIKRLEDDGVIQNYSVAVDMKRCGYNLHLFILIKLKSRDSNTIADFERRIMNQPQITTCQLVTGPYDYILQVFLPNMEGYNDFLRSVLSELPGVFGLETSVVISPVKETPALPIPVDF